jgi:pyridoxine 5-phosphate synthase
MEKTSMEYLRLGVNIDHVATVRNARGGIHPSPVAAALLAQKAGADGITAHLREDRRHIRDDDITALKEAIDIPLNFEMAATEEMVAIALKLLPNAACIVPERREELTTEGGLAVAGQQARLSPLIQQLKGAGIRVSLFVDADEAELNAAAELGVDIVELHTGQYCDSVAGSLRSQELERIAKGAQIAASAGLEVHAGHGLSFETVQEIAALPEIVELNIGHFLIGAAIYTGLEDVILQMRQLMNQARAAA